MGLNSLLKSQFTNLCKSTGVEIAVLKIIVKHKYTITVYTISVYDFLYIYFFLNFYF